jgi:hypothetical protein
MQLKAIPLAEITIVKTPVAVCKPELVTMHRHHHLSGVKAGAMPRLKILRHFKKSTRAILLSRVIPTAMLGGSSTQRHILLELPRLSTQIIRLTSMRRVKPMVMMVFTKHPRVCRCLLCILLDRHRLIKMGTGLQFRSSLTIMAIMNLITMRQRL